MNADPMSLSGPAGHTPPPEVEVWDAAALASEQSLTLFQKLLLCTDGTVTELLALYCGKPIQAKKLSQFMRVGPLAGLGCVDGARVLERSVLLGSADGGVYLHARSYFVFDRFSTAIQRDLIDTEQPIGLMWRAERLEMYREITDRRRQCNPAIAALLGVAPELPLLSRTYRIIHGGFDLGIITETFAGTVLA